MRESGAMRRFEGRNVLIVGGGADGPPREGETLAMGNGRAIALRLAAEGARVAVTDRALASAQETVEALDGDGLAIEADAVDVEACREAVRRAETELGPLHVVVCNVGISGQQPGRIQTVEDWELTNQVNVRSHWVTAQEALGPMLGRGHGVFVFVSSTAGVQSTGSSLAYEATKSALHGVARHFGVRYASRGIRSNALALGIIDSTMVRRHWGDEDTTSAWRDRQIPIGRQGTCEEAASAAAFLASDDASFVTGTVLIADGGRTAGAMYMDPPS